MGFRRFRSIYLTKTLITIASNRLLWPIGRLFYMRVPVGYRRFWSIHLTKTLITIASNRYLWPIGRLFYMRVPMGSSKFWSIYLTYTLKTIAWVPMSDTMTFLIRGFPWVPVGSHGFPWVAMGCHGFLYISKLIYFKNTPISSASYEFLWLIRWLFYILGSRRFRLIYLT